jgi:hypothetical protein
VRAIFDEPAHPYTRRLVGSILRADKRVPLPALAPVDPDVDGGGLAPVGHVPGHVAAAVRS